MLQHNSYLPLRNCKSLIKTKFKDIRKFWYNNIASGKSWECRLQDKNRIPLDLPRRIGVACLRMLTGHDYLQQHRNKIDVTTSASCPLCGDNSMNGRNLLICSKLQDLYTGVASRLSLSHLY
ncbi:putative gag-pol polyprotein [Caerostris darwini]|uniref:Gag-pol polyprotein n=1 Tax=Caerostris darwini TaxID=1538125 RepID=A0AAV4Q0P8_9ARAC|nr:putative gag-pol polyprotein [Caerostris darwini]